MPRKYHLRVFSLQPSINLYWASPLCTQPFCDITHYSFSFSLLGNSLVGRYDYLHLTEHGIDFRKVKNLFSGRPRFSTKSSYSKPQCASFPLYHVACVCMDSDLVSACSALSVMIGKTNITSFIPIFAVLFTKENVYLYNH